MENIISNYVLFLIKIITLLIIIIAIFIKITQRKTDKNFKIININEEFKKNTNKLLKELNIKNKNVTTYKRNKNLIILDFNGDIQATAILDLKNIISYLITILNEHDEIIVRINSSGGFINNYGLAANQFERIKKKNIKLTMSIDLIAASGGYLIASVGEKIIASEFAIIGSIGVIGIVPNINKLLKKYNIEIEHHTTGEYKNTLSILGENTQKGREKFIQSLNNAHEIFKQYIKKNRKDINIENVSTGEYWYGKHALKENLIDEIKTSDEFIMEKMQEYNIFIIKKNEH